MGAVPTSTTARLYRDAGYGASIQPYVRHLEEGGGEAILPPHRNPAVPVDDVYEALGRDASHWRGEVAVIGGDHVSCHVAKHSAHGGLYDASHDAAEAAEKIGLACGMAR